ncbi:hypothetical protein HMPREF9419_0143 [Prevotella nigrescens ATCC 33563]|nr:hypothetical protein HMPREF9419_0143 [Prevotella nigrescens ATCC 33563]
MAIRFLIYSVHLTQDNRMHLLYFQSLIVTNKNNRFYFDIIVLIAL